MARDCSERKSGAASNFFLSFLFTYKLRRSTPSLHATRNANHSHSTMSTRTNEALAHRRKRVRFDGDSSASASSLSEESALVPTSVTDHSTDASDIASESDSDMSSSSEEPSDDSSSEEDDDDDEDVEDGHSGDGHHDTHMADTQEDVTNLRANQGVKPVMKLNQEELGPDIRDFLKDFLPQLKKANEELEAQKKAGTLKSMDTADEEEKEDATYIEMDLGLGVLEEKDGESEGDATETETETDRLGKLMGRDKKDAAGIEVVQDTNMS